MVGGTCTEKRLTSAPSKPVTEKNQKKMRCPSSRKKKEVLTSINLAKGREEEGKGQQRKEGNGRSRYCARMYQLRGRGSSMKG